MKRTLQLKSETLGSLTDADLSGVVGGALTREGGGLTCGGTTGVQTNVSCGCIEIGSLHHCLYTKLPTCYCNTFPNC